MGDDYEREDGGSRAGKFGGLSWNKKPRRRSGTAASGNDSSDKYQSAKKGKQNATASVDEKRMRLVCRRATGVFSGREHLNYRRMRKLLYG